MIDLPTSNSSLFHRRRTSRMEWKTNPQLLPPPAPGQPMGLTGAMCLQYPLSRGTVHIKSSDPNEHPTVDPNFMSNPADASVLAAGAKVCTGALLPYKSFTNYEFTP